MCGIAGIVTRDGSPPDEGLIRRMMDAIPYRGRDGEGVWIKPGVGLGHRRLAIVDLSPLAAQPMTLLRPSGFGGQAPDGRFTIVYNGEIYNFRELREELSRLGSTFRSTSDTEVILEAYRRWGEDSVKRLRGMFAFVIWDATTRRLFFARDRIGKKPFFYRVLTNGSFAFASELKALIPLEPVTIDPAALRQFIGLQYVPPPRTGFREIVGVPQGHRGYADANGVRIESYHDWASIPVSASGDVSRDIVSLLDDAVKIRLQADVPVGAFLSGGVDSAAVVALAVKHLDRPLRTFTMGFPNIGMDERAEAREIATAFHTDHLEFEAKPDDLARVAEYVINQYDAPYADSSSLPLMLLSEQASQQIKVVLTGDGGDETFGGYRRYVAFDRALRLAAIPGFRSIAPPLARIVGTEFNDPRFIRVADAAPWAKRDPNRAYAELFCGSYFSSTQAAGVFHHDFLEQTSGDDPAAFIAKQMGTDGEPLARALRFDLMSYLPDDLNVKMDRATMAYGLEARAPFLDQYLVAYALRLPLNEKVHHGKTKVALKRALRGIVPSAVLSRKKRGFQVPLADWFRGPLNGYWRERCIDPKGPLAAYVQLPAVQRLFDENTRGTNHGNRLWMLLALSIWLSRYERPSM